MYRRHSRAANKVQSRHINGMMNNNLMRHRCECVTLPFTNTSRFLAAWAF